MSMTDQANFRPRRLLGVRPGAVGYGTAGVAPGAAFGKRKSPGVFAPTSSSCAVRVGSSDTEAQEILDRPVVDASANAADGDGGSADDSDFDYDADDGSWASDWRHLRSLLPHCVRRALPQRCRSSACHISMNLTSPQTRTIRGFFLALSAVLLWVLMAESMQVSVSHSSGSPEKCVHRVPICYGHVINGPKRDSLIHCAILPARAGPGAALARAVADVVDFLLCTAIATDSDRRRYRRTRSSFLPSFRHTC